MCPLPPGGSENEGPKDHMQKARFAPSPKGPPQSPGSSPGRLRLAHPQAFREARECHEPIRNISQENPQQPTPHLQMTTALCPHPHPPLSSLPPLVITPSQSRARVPAGKEAGKGRLLAPMPVELLAGPLPLPRPEESVATSPDTRKNGRGAACAPGEES